MTGPLATILEGLSLAIEILSVVILTIGAGRFLWDTARPVLRSGDRTAMALQRARMRLGIYILTGLEFLIVADIIYTVVHRDLDDVITLAIVAGVRTLISVFLNREIREMKESEAVEPL